MSTGAYGARISRSGGASTTRLGRYELRVTAPSAAEVVASAGGWLVDRAMAGWNVSVVLTGDQDPEPLRILGVDTRSSGDDGDGDGPLRSQSIAVSSTAIALDDTLRGDVARAVRRGVAEVTVWGDAGRDLVPGLSPVEHVLSSAARAFKARALHAAGLPDVVEPVEFFAGRTSAVLSGYSDLTPASVAMPLAQR